MILVSYMGVFSYGIYSGLVRERENLPGYVLLSTESREEYDRLMKAFDDDGSMRWISGKYPIGEDRWGKHQENTVIGIQHGTVIIYSHRSTANDKYIYKSSELLDRLPQKLHEELEPNDIKILYER